MSPRITSAMACCLLAAIPPRAVGFTPPPIVATPHLAPLPMASSVHAPEDYPKLLSGAALCADSESCSVESAQRYLREIVYVQSGCAAGTLSGADVCGDVQGVSEVVANLRRKIKEGAKREVRTFWSQRQAELETLAVATDGVAALSAPLKPAYLAIAVLYAMAIIATFQPTATEVLAGGTAPFSAQEVWWAVRDGYFLDLSHHLFRHGGLLVSEPVATAGLTPQELWWSIRDGYAADTLFDDGGGGVELTPLTPEEVWWAVRQGYTADLAQHWYRNGGL